MSNSASEDSALQHWREERGNYQDTVQALLAFAALVVHDGRAIRPGAAFGFGRHMTHPPTEISGVAYDVTPDLVAQRSPAYGVVVEAKATLPKDHTRWDRHVEQLRKYDDHLLGWWTGDSTIPQYDAVLLVNLTYSVALGEHLELLRAKDPNAVGPTTAIVEYSRQDQVESWILYRLHWGHISDTDLHQELHYSKNVPIDRVLASFGAVKFYDADPPLPYLLEELWLNVLPSLVADQDYDHDLKAFPVAVTVEQITDELQKAHGSKRLQTDSRSAEFPTRTNIRDALDELVRLGLAARGGEQGTYTVAFKHQKGDVFAWFVKLLSKHSGKNPKDEVSGQLPLFPEQNGVNAK